jgi:CheY-like chemotaxis protein
MAAAAARRARGQKARILVVDDDADIRLALTEELEGSGFVVDCAIDGEDALEQLLVSTARPDLIVLDLKMPRRSGYEVLNVLRSSVTLVDVPVVVLSAHLGSPPAGAVAWLKKPFRSEELLRAVARYTGPAPRA